MDKRLEASDELPVFLKDCIRVKSESDALTECENYNEGAESQKLLPPLNPEHFSYAIQYHRAMLIKNLDAYWKINLTQPLIDDIVSGKQTIDRKEFFLKIKNATNEDNLLKNYFSPEGKGDLHNWIQKIKENVALGAPSTTEFVAASFSCFYTELQERNSITVNEYHRLVKIIFTDQLEVYDKKLVYLYGKYYLKNVKT